VSLSPFYSSNVLNTDSAYSDLTSLRRKLHPHPGCGHPKSSGTSLLTQTAQHHPRPTHRILTPPAVVPRPKTKITQTVVLVPMVQVLPAADGRPRRLGPALGGRLLMLLLTGQAMRPPRQLTLRPPSGITEMHRLHLQPQLYLGTTDIRPVGNMIGIGTGIRIAILLRHLGLLRPETGATLSNPLLLLLQLVRLGMTPPVWARTPGPRSALPPPLPPLPLLRTLRRAAIARHPVNPVRLARPLRLLPRLRHLLRLPLPLQAASYPPPLPPLIPRHIPTPIRLIRTRTRLQAHRTPCPTAHPAPPPGKPRVTLKNGSSYLRSRLPSYAHRIITMVVQDQQVTRQHIPHRPRTRARRSGGEATVIERRHGRDTRHRIGLRRMTKRRCRLRLRRKCHHLKSRRCRVRRHGPHRELTIIRLPQSLRRGHPVLLRMGMVKLMVKP
jgi:hypothetical protein